MCVLFDREIRFNYPGSSAEGISYLRALITGTGSYPEAATNYL